MQNQQYYSDSIIATDRTLLFSPVSAPESELLTLDSQYGLRKSADTLPSTVWYLATIELCERFAFFGVLGPMQNYIQHSSDEPLQSGGLGKLRKTLRQLYTELKTEIKGLGQNYATIINQGFMVWCYTTPILGAITAESYLGRVKTIEYTSIIYSCGLLTLVLSSLPIASDHGASLWGLLLSLFLIGIGAGGMKSNVGPLLAEQYVDANSANRIARSGQPVIIDRDLTMRRIFTTLSLSINIGSFIAMTTTVVEQKYGFSAAFTMPLVVHLTGLLILFASKDRFTTEAPKSSIIFHSFREFWITTTNRYDSTHAGPPIDPLAGTSDESNAMRNTIFDDMKSAFSVCRVFSIYPFYWAAYSQFRTNLVSQAATMETYGIPNDIIASINPIAVLILLPTLDRLIFPFASRIGIPATYKNRMTAGFLFCSISMVYVAFVQRNIYGAPPCYEHPRAQNCMNGRLPNKVSVFLQVPSYILIAISEVLAAVAGIEYAYTKAPKSMRSLTMAIYLSTMSVGVLTAMAISPMMSDPNMTWIYFAFGAEAFIGGMILRLILRHRD